MFQRSYLVYAAIVLVFSVGLAVWMRYNAEEKYADAASRAAASLAEITDRWLSDSQKMSVSAGQIDELLQLAAHETAEMDFSSLDAVLLSSAQHALVAACAVDMDISHLGVYFYDRKYVVTDTGTLGLDRFYQSLFAAQADPQSEYLQSLSPGRFLFIRQGAVGNMAPAAPVFVTSVIDRNGKQFGNLFIFWNSRSTAAALAAAAGEDVYYSVYDASGEAMFSSDSQFLPLETRLKMLQAAGERPVTVPVSTFSKWSVVTGVPVSNLYRQLWHGFFVVLAVLGALLLAGIPLTLFLCAKNYAPIQALAYCISPHQDDATSQEIEYEALLAAVTGIIAGKKNFEEQFLIYRPLLINSLLMELLNGAQNKEETLSALRTLDVSIPFPYLQCVSVLGVNLSQTAMLALAQELRVPERCACYAATYSSRSCIFLLNADSEETCREAAAMLESRLDDAAAVREWGASEIMDSPDFLEQANLHARKILDYAVPGQGPKGCDWPALEDSGVMQRSRPDSLRNLFPTFAVGRAAEARETILDYFDRIIVNGFAAKAHLQFMQESMGFCLDRLHGEYGVCCDDGPLRRWSPDDRDAAQALKDIVLDVCRTLQDAVEALQSRRQEQEELALLAFLDEHLFDVDLSLTLLSNRFALSESVVSRRIKGLTGQNFLDYVNQKRIEQAAMLLRQTETSVNDLAAAVGYASDITFRRLFKKYMGVTPSEYRSAALAAAGQGEKNSSDG